MRARWSLFRLFISAFVTGLSGALAPGPLTIAVIDHAARTGALAGPLATGGHAVLELLMSVLLGLGLARLLKRRTVAGTIALSGGLMLLWMSWGMLVSSRTSTLAPIAGMPTLSGSGLGAALLAGIITTLGNPYWFLWWVTVGASQLSWAGQAARGGTLVFWFGHVSSDLLWLTLLSIAVATGRQFLTDSMYRGLLYILGAVIGLLGLYFLGSARKIYAGSTELQTGE